MAVHIASHEHRSLVVPAGYAPLFVGAARHAGLVRQVGWHYDDEGDSISVKNDTFCELTGLYWAWRHDPDDVVGLAHYRRYFTDATGLRPLSADELTQALLEADCVVAERHHFTCLGRRPASVAEHYRLFHSSADLRILRDVVRSRARGYLDAFDAVMARTWMYPCNMVVCLRPVLEAYCAFLFDVLGGCEHAIDAYAFRGTYQRRVFGFLSERLLNVFIERWGLSVAEVAMGDPNGGGYLAPPSPDLPDAMPYLRPETPLPPFAPRHGHVSYAPVFDARFYLAHHGDVYAACGNDPAAAFAHFVDYGLAEGRQAHPCFSVESYRRAHPGLLEACGGDLHRLCRHYLRTRATELHAFGFEHLEPAGAGPASATFGEAGRQALDGRPIRPSELRRALRRAARQGAID